MSRIGTVVHQRSENQRPWALYLSLRIGLFGLQVSPSWSLYDCYTSITHIYISTGSRLIGPEGKKDSAQPRSPSPSLSTLSDFLSFSSSFSVSVNFKYNVLGWPKSLFEFSSDMKNLR